jgi:hypothetical protein
MSDGSGSSDGFLMLKAQLHLKGDTARFEPLPFSN